ncbi:hypothetical protein E2542_SST22019 [Spatholobus suberectus]|nr:hypothetical protein E2542_SST22019 [Spatholobus suberectus]
MITVLHCAAATHVGTSVNGRERSCSRRGATMRDVTEALHNCADQHREALNCARRRCTRVVDGMEVNHKITIDYFDLERRIIMMNKIKSRQ